MSKIKRFGAGGQHYTIFEMEDGRLFTGGIDGKTQRWEWDAIPPLPETKAEIERRELEERARNLGLTVPDED